MFMAVQALPPPEGDIETVPNPQKRATLSNWSTSINLTQPLGSRAPYYLSPAAPQAASYTARVTNPRTRLGSGGY